VLFPVISCMTNFSAAAIAVFPAELAAAVASCAPRPGFAAAAGGRGWGACCDVGFGLGRVCAWEWDCGSDAEGRCCAVGVTVEV
jgi:hypothetical protein